MSIFTGINPRVLKKGDSAAEFLYIIKTAIEIKLKCYRRTNPVLFGLKF